MQRVLLNILEDFDSEKRSLRETVRATFNILEDLDQSNAELRRAHEVLEARVAERTAELARSNQDLEQFASVASHDLQEPLRMISSYLQILAGRYRGRLDEDADKFIGYAVDGAQRLQTLINDLLAYSRVGTRGGDFGDVSLEAVLGQATANLQVAIRETGATISHEPLPLVHGDGRQLVQVFQNLLSNAIKFHGGAAPAIHVAAKLEGSQCVCSVRDNGIGIAPEHVQRLFVLFQRLHTRREYPGTGIGLAICRRIVERHGGWIRLESKPGEGSTFLFSLPLRWPEPPG